METSSNLASVTPIKTAESSGAGGGGGTYEILCSTRSSLSPPLEVVRRRIKKAAELCGASNVLRRQAYPGWQPNLQSNVLKVIRLCCAVRRPGAVCLLGVYYYLLGRAGGACVLYGMWVPSVVSWLHQCRTECYHIGVSHTFVVCLQLPPY